MNELAVCKWLRDYKQRIIISFQRAIYRKVFFRQVVLFCGIVLKNKEKEETLLENLELILSLAGTAFSLFIACIIFIIKIVQAIRSKKKTINATMLEEVITPLMEIAESFRNYSGEEKKQFVMTKVNQFAIENNLKFDADYISEKIEQFIKLSKKVNAK